ncbi:sugar O-acyltransferase, sialic acid O-acetyltransferase NeuD family [Algoriphagus hitonicola]|uniref:Sugar O-acyltransferase, sialic acid O-acetyltransferase NeuD family n=2 Tax=Algoriphagus hitonicola TaxID=435880 RepID=A0A1I2X3H0_9BACT|nr:sugar O-acyltransferase, sialic acid O-acetyltransferase NeuD family [Algoriphagus hitonicola]
MNQIKLLGVSQDSVALIFDALEHLYQIEYFNLYTNIAVDFKPFLPVKKVDYAILDHAELNNVQTDKYFFGTAGGRTKRLVFEFFQENYGVSREQFVQLVMPNSYVSAASLLENATFVEPGVTVGPQSKIRFGTYLKRGVTVGHHNDIGEFCDINPGVVLSGKIKIGDDCIIGSGTVVRDNIEIGENSIIGVGSVVTKDIPTNSVAFGNPCKVVKENKL